MARSLKVSKQFIEKVKQAVQLQGYPRQRDLAEDLALSLATVSSFLNGKPIDILNFQDICQRLNLDWREIADLSDIEKVDVNVGSGLGANIDAAPTLSHVLHISDLHFGTTDNARTWYAKLAEDLRYELACSRLDAVIISGDIASKSNPDEYAAAELFINRLSQEFQLESHQIVIVPGNHDINWEISQTGYSTVRVEETNKERHQQRFIHFSHFYEAIKGEIYPLDYEQQYTWQHLPEQKLLILGLNSAWQIDHIEKHNASINSEALSNALSLIRQNPTYGNCLKLAVWHHSLNSTFNDRITDSGIMERLAAAGFRFILHGSVHGADNSSYHYDYSVDGKQIDIIGAGIFGISQEQQPYKYPWQYNFLKIEENKVTIETRKRDEVNGVWIPDTRWRKDSTEQLVSQHVIFLSRNNANVTKINFEHSNEPNVYIERPPIEEKCLKAIVKPGALIRITAPRQMGKTSLMTRILHYASQKDHLTVHLSFQLADAKVFTDLDLFLRWFFGSIADNLNLPDKLTEYWRDSLGSKASCTRYFKRYLLSEIKSPVVLGLDEVDLIFQNPEIANDFFGMLRSWHEKAKIEVVWKKLRLIVVHSKEVYMPMNVNQSPFNVGISIELPEFNQQQVQQMMRKYQLDSQLGEQGIIKLMTLVGGNPYLLQSAISKLKSQEISLESLMTLAPTQQGIFSYHLRQKLASLQADSQLEVEYKKVVRANVPVQLETYVAFKLRSLGLVKFVGNNCVPSCDLYRKYFSQHLLNNYFYAILLTTSRISASLGLEIEVLISLKSLTASNNNGYVLQLPQNKVTGNELNIFLAAPGFHFNNDNTTSLPLDPNTANITQTATFNLTALRPGKTKIQAELYVGETYKTTLETEVEVTAFEETQLRPLIAARSRPVPQPSLILQVRTTWNADISACVFNYHIDSYQSRLLFADNFDCASQPLSAIWVERTQQLLKATLEDAANSQPGDFRSRLVSFGQYLFQSLFPEELQSTFRTIANLNHPFTLLIIADQDAWFPWELFHDGKNFLGDRLIIGRWLWELEKARPYEFPVGAVNVAHYANVGQPELWNQLLYSSGAPPPIPMQAGIFNDMGLFESIRGLHLIRYGQSADAENRQDAPVRIDKDIGEIEREVQPAKLSLRRNHPLVSLSYLNAGQMELTALEQTWASTFVRAGCSGFVGSLWAVQPDVEAAFISAFYNNIWSGQTLAVAFNTARRLAKAVVPESLDWLAYVLFGDPIARPYRPVPGQGYAVVEPIGQEIDDPVAPGTTVRFRVSLRRTPPVWYENRLMEVAEDLSFDDLRVFIVTSGLEVTPGDSIIMTSTATGDYLGWFMLSVPSEIETRSVLVQVYFEDGIEPVHSLRFSLKIGDGEFEGI